MADYSCKVNKAVFIVQSFLAEAQYCSVCRHNFNAVLDILKKIQDGDAGLGDLEIINELVKKNINLCQCGAGKRIARELKVHLREHRDDFLVHIENRVCPSSECPRLVPAPCQAVCPAGIDIPYYITMVGMGRYEEALERIREDVPLPGSLGRICEHPCERACRRGQVDKPVSICALKRFAYDKCSENGAAVPACSKTKYDEKVAVVGAGPAGLSAAYFLARKGYGVTVFEAMPEPGGMLAYGIPSYRLPMKILRDEIDRIKKMGVEIIVNTPVTGDNGIEALKRKGYRAVFLGVGAWKGIMPIAGGEQFEGVFDAVSFLTGVNKELNEKNSSENIKFTGKTVVVVGGGNVAIDAARVSLRLGAGEVRVLYRRTRDEMPALLEEIEDAEKEGVKFDFLISPIGLGGEDGYVKYIECQKNTLSEPDAGGRRKPVPVDNSEFKIETGAVIFATGQKPELSFLRGDAQKVIDNKGRIAVNPVTMETALPGVFAGGDAVTGPASAIKAMAAGKQAAAAIDAYLRGKKPAAGINYPVKRKSIEPIKINAEEKTGPGRINMHELYMPEKQNTFEEIMQAVSDDAAVAEAKRCLRCDLCIACGECVKSCRDKVGKDALHLGYVNGEQNSKTDFYRPGEKCIGCGTCSVNCPTGAITLEDSGGFREMRMCGTLISRLELASCAMCGQYYATRKHLHFIEEKVDDEISTEYSNKDVCPECARKLWVQRNFAV